MSLSLTLHGGYYTGAAAVSSLVPRTYDCALGGHSYLIDRESGLFRHQTIPLLRPQTQTSDKLGESSINPAGLWRSSVETWHKGAGQVAYDLADSDPARFRTSKGVDPWERWELSLLPRCDQKLTTVETNLMLCPAGDYLYVVDGPDVKSTLDVTAGSPTWTTVEDAPGTDIFGIATDGYYLYATDGASIFQWARGASSMGAAWATFDSDLLGYVKGRLMSGHDNICSNVTGSATKFDVVTHPNADFRWVSFAEGRNCIYMAGFSGDKSLIYRTTVKADGTNLDVGVVAGELPDGELVRCIYGYLGFVLIGTDKGIRFALADTSGDLTIGALIETDSAVLAFEGQERFVWFSWTNYDAVSTGLGRLDLEILNGSAPAYASDLMVDAQGEVQGVVTFQGLRVFTVAGSGVWAEDTIPVLEGTVESGVISYGIADDKVALLFDLRHQALEGSVSAALAVNEGAFQTIGISDILGSPGVVLPAGEKVGERFETRLTLALEDDTSPVVTRTVLRMNPTADTSFVITVPVLLSTVDVLAGGARQNRDVDAEYAYLRALRASRDVVLYQEGNDSYSVALEDFQRLPQSISDSGAWESTVVLSLKVVSNGT